MNNYLDYDPYGTYDSKGQESPYSLLMKMQSWHKEIRSTVVAKDDYTGEIITSMIVQNAESITLLARELNLLGLVNFEDLEGVNGRTIIHGGNILTRTIVADHLLVTELSAIAADLGIVNAGIINGVFINSAYINVEEDVAVGQWLTIGRGFDTAEKGIRFTGTTVGIDVYGDTLNIGATDIIFSGRVDGLYARFG